MAARFAPDDDVQTPFGKGVILEVRNGGIVLVRVHDRAILLGEGDIRPLARAGRPASQGHQAGAAAGPVGRGGPGGSRTLDLHGDTVEAALARVDAAISDALLDDVGELRVIHGRSGGRLRAAVQRHLRDLPVRSVRLDPKNPGVTVVLL